MNQVGPGIDCRLPSLKRKAPPAGAVVNRRPRTGEKGGISRDRAGYPHEAVVHKAVDRQGSQY